MSTNSSWIVHPALDVVTTVVPGSKPGTAYAQVPDHQANVAACAVVQVARLEFGGADTSAAPDPPHIAVNASDPINTTEMKRMPFSPDGTISEADEAIPA